MAMIGNVLAKRYAKALLEPLNAEKAEVVKKDLDTFQQILQISPEMKKLLLSPIFGLEEKKGILKLLSEKVGFCREAQRFFELLLEKDRLKYFKEIKTFFEELLYERKKRVKAYVISSNSFSSAYEAELRERLKRLTKREVDMDIKTDPSLIGGVVIRIGDVIYDGSIKGQLSSLKEGLLGK
jgi:F-type H+-transporting ATPase subunit delta